MEVDYHLPAKANRLGRDLRRANRPVTLFACELIDKFVDDNLEPGVYDCHNTKISPWTKRASPFTSRSLSGIAS
jgi:hypothetical protein